MSNFNLLDRIAEITKKSEKQTPKQKKILEVAITTFAEKGYSNTSTAEIAKLAGVAEGTIFKHYGTKENLLLAIMVPFLKDHASSLVDELFTELMDEKISFKQFIRNLLKNRIEFLSKNKEIFLVFFKEFIYKEELKKELIPYFLEKAAPRLKEVIEIAQKRGEIIDKPVIQITNMIATTIAGFLITRFAILNVESVNDNEIEEIVHLIMHGIGK